MIRHIMAGLAAGLAVLSVSACTTLTPAAAETVSQVEQRRFAAMVGQDVAALETLLADELTYTHASGQVDTKPQYLEAIRSGRIRYHSISVEEVAVHQYRDIAVLTGRANLKATAAGVMREMRNRFTDVYVYRDGRWQMVAWQSTTMP